MRTAVDSRSGLKRNEEQRSNHSEGEQRGLDGVREVHVTNIDSMFTSTDLPQRTYSQRFGNPALDEDARWLMFVMHPERPCALPTDPSWGTVV